MNGVMRIACLALVGSFFALPFAPPLAHAQDVPALVDATMEAMRGGSHTLSAERGHRAVVLFYDDRDHIEDNAVFKGDLERFIIDNHLDDRVITYGVANLADVGMVPHALVRSMISPLLDRFRTDILLDWDGVMRRPPFSFPTAATTCAIIDRSGAILYRYSGTIDEAQRRTFYRMLRAAISAGVVRGADPTQLRRPGEPGTPPEISSGH